MNTRGQSGLSLVKQLQIEAFARTNNCDIIHLQEAHLDSDTISTCDFIQSTFHLGLMEDPDPAESATAVKCCPTYWSTARTLAAWVETLTVL